MKCLALNAIEVKFHRNQTLIYYTVYKLFKKPSRKNIFVRDKVFSKHRKKLNSWPTCYLTLGGYFKNIFIAFLVWNHWLIFSETSSLSKIYINAYWEEIVLFFSHKLVGSCLLLLKLCSKIQFPDTKKFPQS